MFIDPTVIRFRRSTLEVCLSESGIQPFWRKMFPLFFRLVSAVLVITLVTKSVSDQERRVVVLVLSCELWTLEAASAHAQKFDSVARNMAACQCVKCK